jgi:glycerol-3-phosphate acyltransferase PlsY
VILSTVLAYLLGGLPFGYWFVRVTSGRDIRTMGSGNIGATNVQRSMGMKAGVVVLFLDILKGFLAVWFAALLTHRDATSLALAVAAVMLGHCYPVFLHFKGGKAVACFVGAFLYIAPLALLITTAVFVAVVAFSKYVSLGSILGALVFPFALWLVNRPPRAILYASIFAAALVIYRHKGNIARLRAGKENAFGRK